MTDKRAALITGGGKGVGAGIARVFAENGIAVAIGFNSSAELAEKTLRDITDKGGEAIPIKADVADPKQVQAMVDEAVNRFGRLDILVNNAALQPNLYISEYTPQTFERLWQINIGGYFRVTKACLPYLKQSDTPRVINVSSVHGKRPAVFDAGYSMTKSAIKMFTRECALEFAKYGITVNTIDLGACKIEGKTGHFPFRLAHDKGTHINPGQPLGRIVYPEDVGQLAYFLASREAETLDGDGIRIDGGSMLT